MRRNRNETFERLHDDAGTCCGDGGGGGRTLNRARASFRSIRENAFMLRVEPYLPATAVRERDNAWRTGFRFSFSCNALHHGLGPLGVELKSLLECYKCLPVFRLRGAA